MKLNLSTIAAALDQPNCRRQIFKSYGVPEREELSAQDMLFDMLRQKPSLSSANIDYRPANVIRSAVWAIGSNSRSWSSFFRQESALSSVLSAYDPAEIRARPPMSGAELKLYFPGMTSTADTKAVIAWCWKYPTESFKDDVENAIGHVQEKCARLPEVMNKDTPFMMPLLSLLFAMPPKDVSLQKFPGMGATLASEFFRNLGWSGFKPDRHVHRLLKVWATREKSLSKLVEEETARARSMASALGYPAQEAVDFLACAFVGLALTPTEVAYSKADNLLWALGAYVEKKGHESTACYLTD